MKGKEIIISQSKKSNIVHTDTPLYIRELEAIVACNQSDGYLKKWAEERLEEMHCKIKHIAPQTKIFVAV